MVNATQTENRTAYACRPTNEDSIAAFLVDRNDYHFFNCDIVEKPKEALATFFTSRCNRRDEFILVDCLPQGILQMEKGRKNQDNSLWPSWRINLQSSKIKVSSSEE